MFYYSIMLSIHKVHPKNENKVLSFGLTKLCSTSHLKPLHIHISTRVSYLIISGPADPGLSFQRINGGSWPTGRSRATLTSQSFE